MLLRPGRIETFSYLSLVLRHIRYRCIFDPSWQKERNDNVLKFEVRNDRDRSWCWYRLPTYFSLYALKREHVIFDQSNFFCFENVHTNRPTTTHVVSELFAIDNPNFDLQQPCACSVHRCGQKMHARPIIWWSDLCCLWWGIDRRRVDRYT